MRALDRFLAIVGLTVTGLGPPGRLQASALAETPAKPPPLSAPEVESKVLARSRVPLTLSLDLDWARQQLEERVPKVLHEEKNREVSRGIWLDARVVRGPIELRFGEDHATAATPIELQLSARGRLGALAVKLGHCASKIDFEVSVTPRLGTDGKVPRPVAKATLTQPCRLSGFDVTPIIEREISQQVARAQDDAQAQLAPIDAFLSESYQNLFRSIAGKVYGCTRFVPERLLQPPLHEDQGTVTAPLVFEGVVVESCVEPQPKALAVETIPAPLDFELALPQRTAFAELARGLTERLASTGVKCVVDQIRAVHVRGKDQLALLLRTPQHQVWILAQPQLAHHAVHLTHLSSKNAKALAALRSKIEAIRVPIDTRAVDALAPQLVNLANDASIFVGAAQERKERTPIDASIPKNAIELLVDRDALVVNLRRSYPTRAR